MTNQTAVEIMDLALKSGLRWAGGHFPSGRTISYKDGADVTLDDVRYQVIGNPGGGYWMDRIWINGSGGGFEIQLDGKTVFTWNDTPQDLRKAAGR